MSDANPKYTKEEQEKAFERLSKVYGIPREDPYSPFTADIPKDQDGLYEPSLAQARSDMDVPHPVTAPTHVVSVNHLHETPVVIPLTPKVTLHAYMWCIFLGAQGAHNFYLGKRGKGFLYLFTLGLLGVGPLVDLFTLPGQVRKVNAVRAMGYARA